MFFGLVKLNSFPHEISHLWFIKYILICYLATPVYLKLFDFLEHKNTKTYIFVLLVSLIINDLFFKGLFNLIGAWMNCYFLGIIFYKIKVNQKIANSYLATGLFILTIILNVAQIYIDKIFFNTDFITSRFSEYIHWYAHIFLGISITVILGALYKNFEQVFYKLIRFLDLSDKYSYDVYICHHIFILGNFSLLALPLTPFTKTFILIFSIAISAYVLNTISSYIKLKIKLKERFK